MQIRVLCIDDSGRPKEIPANLWPKKDEQYHITWIYKIISQPGVKGVELAEFDISKCDPYNSYRLSRFAIAVEDLDLFKQMCQDSSDMNDVDVDNFVKELLEKDELVLVED